MEIELSCTLRVAHSRVIPKARAFAGGAGGYGASQLGGDASWQQVQNEPSLFLLLEPLFRLRPAR